VITFYGKWSLDVIANVGEFQQRLRIVGSVASDGLVAGTVGTQVPEIDGNPWNVFMERSSDGGVTWLPNLVQRIPSVTPKDGLIVTLFGDDSVVPPQDSDVSVQFVYLNRQVNPKGPAQPPFAFTLPAGQFWPKRPPEICPCCCKWPCNCRGKKGLKRGRCCSG
jgi:hypothetical protein